MSNESEEKIMTTAELLANYSDSIQQGLDNGAQYLKAFHALSETDDNQSLLSAAVALTNFGLNTEFVTFPHQFSDEDVQLIFFSRLLSLSGINSNFQISNPQRVQKLLCRFDSLGDQTFTFTKSSKNADGFFFGPTFNNRPLFYLNLKNKELMFHGSSLIQYFVVDLAELEVNAIKDTLRLLTRAAAILKEKFGFKIDFNVLDSVNGEFYQFAAGSLSENVMDELFVKSAENHFVLMAEDNGGASLTLDNGTKMTVYDADSNNSRPRWGATIHDDQQSENWLYLLLDYPFIKKWYLNNQKQLEILSNQFVFG
ncbi:hypothetical protein [Lentilactobacillus farraginis]|uniref:Uncharacterized protein n=1 Tax=Lentilactobacillus farraginis DSM 18382 = JCM 14108 TaxID=1423743 RepID=X0PA50_9LACO|nr:hypothetical protein [Lentilactobacillus farraginis]KRM04343.1 hypothetical protein FD41_GL000951 [Lentilactobacillus farraginis DSM 18382 = JCM 14108]GAF36023.1 hypothetical protein JCM14108_959 [Lentilactobacillus farraginis DSM 18382 = JCM 14108]